MSDALDPTDPSREQNPVLPLSRRRAEKIYDDILLLGIAPVLTRSPAPDPSTDPKTWGKAAVAQGWNRIPYGEARPAFDHLWPTGEERGYNVGVRTGHVEGAMNCVVVVDCDTPEALAWVREHLPPTPMRTLPSRLEHLYYRVEPGTRVKSLNMRQRMGLDIDLQADGKLVIAPGSVHPSGIPYRTPTPWPENFDVFERKVPMFDPGWFPPEVRDALVGEPVRRSVSVPVSYPAGGGDPGEPDVPLGRRRDRARRYLNYLADRETEHRRTHEGRPDPGVVSVSGMDGQRTLMQVACALVWGFYLPPEVAAEVIHGSPWNNLCCDKQADPYPWEMEGNQGLLRKCSEVLAEGSMLDEKRRPRGYLLAERPDQVSPHPARSGEAAEESALDAEPPTGSSRFVEMDEHRAVDEPWGQNWELNDTGNAARLEARYGDRLMHVPEIGWHVWIRSGGGGRWALSTSTATRWAQRTAQLIGEEVEHAQVEADEARRKVEAAGGEDKELEARAKALAAQAKAAREWHRASGNAARVEGMLKMAAPNLLVTHRQLDQDPYLLACRNGHLNLRSGEFSEANPRRYLTRRADVDYAPGATCPNWERLVSEWLPDRETQRYIQEWAGVTLTADPKLQACLILLGQGGNGKGMLMNTLASMLGDYAVVLDADVLVGGESSGISANSAQEQKLRLRGARMVRVSEAPDDGKLTSKTLKSLVSNDVVIGRRLGQNNVEFNITFKIWLALNHRPTISDTTNAIWRRLKIVRFDQTFVGDKRQAEALIEQSIAAERSGILNWALEGLRRVLARTEGGHLSLVDPQSVQAEVGQYREQMDTVGEWLGECCEVDPGRADQPEFRCKGKDLYEEFYVWCSLQHIRFIRGRNTFYDDLSSKGVSQRKVSNLLYFCGIRLTSRQNRGEMRGKGSGAPGSATVQ